MRASTQGPDESADAALKAAKDRVYNFDCDGCREHRRKYGSRMIDGKRYCVDCVALFLSPEQLRPARGRPYEAAEKRGKTKRTARLQALIEWRDRRNAQKRGRA